MQRHLLVLSTRGRVTPAGKIEGSGGRGGGGGGVTRVRTGVGRANTTKRTLSN